MTVKEFLILIDVASDPDNVLRQIAKLPKPVSFGKHIIPDTLNDITMGQLIELQSITSIVDLILSPEHDINCYSVEDLLGFSMWVKGEVERINKLFASTNVKPTKEEQKAGIEDLSFGIFGLIDYYAIRMGISDHEQVEKIPWVRVYKCLDMDARKAQYERRLREIYQKKE